MPVEFPGIAATNDGSEISARSEASNLSYDERYGRTRDCGTGAGRAAI